MLQNQFGYATIPGSIVYHLVDDRETSRTLCDLPTRRTSDSAITLMVSTIQPEHGKLCRHCDDALDKCG
jgi:hypothetical protein